MSNVIELEAFRNRVKNTLENNRNDEVSILSDKQIERILYSTVEGRDDFPTEEELIAVLEWAKDVTIKTNMLNLIYEGRLRVSWDGEGIRLHAK